MKNLSYIALGLGLLLAPTFVLAQEANVSASAEAKVETKTERPRPPIAPAPIKNTIQTGTTLREEARDMASTTRAVMMTERKGLKTMLLDRAEAFKTMLGSSTLQERQHFREESRTALEQKRLEAKAEIDAARKQAQANFSAAVQIHVNNITDRLTNAANALTSIANRIDARISELQAQGKDMTASAALLMGARADIATAQDSVAAAGAALAAALASDTPKEKLAPVRAAVTAAEAVLKTAKQSLQKTLESVRVEGKATTTVTAQ